MTEATKTVRGYFGDKQVTKAEFVKQWVSHFNELTHLANTTAEFDELNSIKAKVIQLAEAKWERIKD